MTKSYESHLLTSSKDKAVRKEKITASSTVKISERQKFLQ